MKITHFLLLFCFLTLFDSGVITSANIDLTRSPTQDADTHPSMSSRLPGIPVPEFVTNLFSDNSNSNRLTTKDSHLTIMLGKPSYGWRPRLEKLIRTLMVITNHYSTVLNNWLVKNVVHKFLDCLTTIQWKIIDWRESPSLEWYLLKANWSTFLYRFYDNYLDSTIKAFKFDDRFLTKTITNIDFYHKYLGKTTKVINSYDNYLEKIIDNINFNRIIHWRDINDKDTIFNRITGNITNIPPAHLTNHINLNHHDLVPDHEGCYHDIFGTILCVDQDSLLNDDELKDRMDTLFEAMTYEDRSHTLRYKQHFIQWATTASRRTTRTLHQALSLWYQQTQVAYRFLDDALGLVPSCNNHHHTNKDRSSSSSSTCPIVLFPFSVSPFDTSFDASSYSFSHPLSMRSTSSPSPSCTTLDRSFFSLAPLQQPGWTSCTQDTNNNNNPKKYDIPDAYNRDQYNYMLSRLEKELMDKLKRLEKELLQEYHRAMVSAPHLWKINHRPYQKQQYHEQDHLQRPGHATQRMYQQLRLYITISFRQLYTNSIQQLMDATRQYDVKAMEQVKQAREEWKWVEQQQQQQHSGHHHHPRKQEQDTDYEAQCQQWWRKKRPWSLTRSLGEFLNDDYNFNLLSVIAFFKPTTQQTTLAPSTTHDTRATLYISQRADMAIQLHRESLLQQWTTSFQNINRRSQSMWVSAMDQVQGRQRLMPDCKEGCQLVLLLVKIFLLIRFLLFF
ncbi:hypothetical protein BC941DRAFT_409110 [Chlamydoabsidia padenii]|nr:hypothetical protein BC941DRAFT_409110 [Chlamydoabsidia padenii]